MLFPRAWNLANAILHSEVAASLVAHDALGRLPGAKAHQDRMEDSLKGKQRKLRLNEKLLLQRFVLEGTRFGEINPAPEAQALYYLKHIVKDCLANTSFHAAIAINVLIYDLQLSEAVRFYTLLTNDADLERIGPSVNLAPLKRRG